jgi:hypothetical protein
LNSDVIATHATWHALVLEDTSRELTATDRSNVTSNFVRTTSHWLTLHVVTSNNSLEATPDRNTGNVDNLAVLEHITNLNLFTYFTPTEALYITANLFDVIESTLASLLE